MTAVPADTTLQQPRDRRHRRTLRTRAAIEEAALRLFAERGFEATTVEQIAEAADIAPRTFFRHFPSKDALLFGDPAHETARMREVLATRPADEHPMRSLAAAMLDAAERMEADRDQHLLRARLLDSLGATGDYEFHLLRQRWVQDVTALVAERLGTTAGDPRAGAWSMALMSCFGAAVHAWLVRTDGTPLRSVLAEVLTGTAEAMGEAADLVGPVG
ncbi:TetR/AcrR family transcriptional regulator [Saccharopolyspora rosea]|uniref:TetR/AcrR family transcriptional regulator n=1 Tax=Saccharopolyspora rosea TaxID=524884 RepID=A0ABW3FV79_9PSEU|nr:TetR/AcrR family transcriptional regulator [Saccharopolyspora rosea]